MNTYENVKYDIYVRIKIKKSRQIHVWLFGVDLTMCILNKRPIIFAMRSNIASNTLFEILNGKIHNGSE